MMKSLGIDFSAPYTIVKIDNNYYNKNGEAVPRKSQQAHILLDEFGPAVFNDFKATDKSTPIMKDHFEYLEAEYGLKWSGFFTFIEDFAKKKSVLSDDQKYLLSVFGYKEVSHDFDEHRKMIRSELRKKDLPIQRDEGLAFIRLCVLVTMFDREMDKAPNNDEDFRFFCLSHPLWPRIEKQARVTLELFKKNRLIRNSYGKKE
ncbi:MAG: hypothetical protein V4654_05000 [Bdellovibrionota bacterium]